MSTKARQQLLTELIEEVMLKRRITQREFARLCGKSHGTVNKWINQESFPEEASLEKLADAIDWSLEALKNYLKTGKKPDFESEIDKAIDVVNRLPTQHLPKIIHHAVERMSSRAAELTGTYV